MTPEDMAVSLKRLKSAYSAMPEMEALTAAAYAQELGHFKYEDFFEATRMLHQKCKFFPSIAECIDAAEYAQRKRLEQQEREEREERLALQAGEDKIMNPKSEVHRFVVGPNHQKFLDMLSGKIQLPEPDWAKRRRVGPLGTETRQNNPATAKGAAA